MSWLGKVGTIATGASRVAKTAGHGIAQGAGKVAEGATKAAGGAASKADELVSKAEIAAQSIEPSPYMKAQASMQSAMQARESVVAAASERKMLETQLKGLQETLTLRQSQAQTAEALGNTVLVERVRQMEAGLTEQISGLQRQLKTASKREEALRAKLAEQPTDQVAMPGVAPDGVFASVPSAPAVDPLDTALFSKQAKPPQADIAKLLEDAKVGTLPSAPTTVTATPGSVAGAQATSSSVPAAPAQRGAPGAGSGTQSAADDALDTMLPSL